MFTKLKAILAKMPVLKDDIELLNSDVQITAKKLSVKEAIGETKRKDFPLLHGKESLIQAEFRGAVGQAFTDMPGSFKGKIKEILELPMANNGERALFIATLNAVMRHYDMTDKTIHCKNESPELCAKEIAKTIVDRYREKIKIGIVGYQPAIIDHFAHKIPVENIKVTDLDKENINTIRYGIPIWDGSKMGEAIFETSDIILATGSTIVNDTLGELVDLSQRYEKPIYFYGTTVAGAASVLNLERLCFQAS
jgi:hypothetical protein